MNLFGRIQHSKCIDELRNFETVPNAMLTLFGMATKSVRAQLCEATDYCLFDTHAVTHAAGSDVCSPFVHGRTTVLQS